ncbi:MAG: sigma 54-interacting transcriptional regulator, partial [Clostridium sp.]|nr:sigma 54-interacting transcriptional regulator [Clostridium sp.]
MKRIDLIYNTVKKLDTGDGVTTLELSNHLNLERSNVSKDLNLLLKAGKLFKNNSRPVKYFFNNPNATDFSKKSTLDKMSYLYPSLSPSIKLAKTAILYPPNGMNSLIIGDTGVGKSMLAKLMHEYANSLDPSKDMPFIHFNCSDYSSNTQLLSAQLFGVK